QQQVGFITFADQQPEQRFERTLELLFENVPEEGNLQRPVTPIFTLDNRVPTKNTATLHAADFHVHADNGGESDHLFIVLATDHDDTAFLAHVADKGVHVCETVITTEDVIHLPYVFHADSLSGCKAGIHRMCA